MSLKRTSRLVPVQRAGCHISSNGVFHPTSGNDESVRNEVIVDFRGIKSGEAVTGHCMACVRLRGLVRDCWRISLPSRTLVKEHRCGPAKLSLMPRPRQTTFAFHRYIVDAPALTDPALFHARGQFMSYFGRSTLTFLCQAAILRGHFP